jgi:hypothetical protein
MPAIDVKIIGLDKLESQYHACFPQPITNFLTRIGEAVRNGAVEAVPVDMGILKNDISYELDDNKTPFPRYVNIGTNVPYAPYIEGGTGILADLPGGKGQPYFPPPSALDGWAKRHGWESGFAVAQAIFRKGGTPPRRFLRNALAEQTKSIDTFMALLATEIEQAAEAASAAATGGKG